MRRALTELFRPGFATVFLLTGSARLMRHPDGCDLVSFASFVSTVTWNEGQQPCQRDTHANPLFYIRLTNSTPGGSDRQSHFVML
jgi:hypothetical protein